MGATSGLCVSVEVAAGVMGDGVNVNVGVRMNVSVGCGVVEAVAEGSTTCVVAGTQACKRKIIKNKEKCFILRPVF